MAGALDALRAPISTTRSTVRNSAGGSRGLQCCQQQGEHAYYHKNRIDSTCEFHQGVCRVSMADDFGTHWGQESQEAQLEAEQRQQSDGAERIGERSFRQQAELLDLAHK